MKLSPLHIIAESRAEDGYNRNMGANVPIIEMERHE
jgi:hypothetical protein